MLYTCLLEYPKKNQGWPNDLYEVYDVYDIEGGNLITRAKKQPLVMPAVQQPGRNIGIVKYQGKNVFLSYKCQGGDSFTVPDRYALYDPKSWTKILSLEGDFKYPDEKYVNCKINGVSCTQEEYLKIKGQIVNTNHMLGDDYHTNNPDAFLLPELLKRLKNKND